MTKILGIDLSLTSPAICLFEGTEVSLDFCSFFYLTSVEKLACSKHPTYGTLIPPYKTNEERYHHISQWIIQVIADNMPQYVFIEDYSFASTGRVFNIAENCGILKYLLWRKGLPFTTIPPTVIKKTATGKGNSNKHSMEESFLKETGFDVRNHLKLSKSASNPVSDIIDSYYVTKAGLHFNRS